MQSLGRHDVRSINDTYRRSGTLREGRDKSTVVDSASYVVACDRYIEANPPRAGMVVTATGYPWSSHPRNALGRHDPLVTDHPAYTGLAPTPEARCQAYATLFHEALDPDLLAAIRDATQRSWVPGPDRFQAEIAAALQRRTTPPRRGRPPKTEKPTEIFDEEQPKFL